MRGWVALLAATAIIGTLNVGPAYATAPYAPVDRPGPALTVPAPALAASLACSDGLDDAARTPVLLVHGTNVTADENWSFVYRPALTAMGTPHCMVRMPNRATDDIQRNVEYVVSAIRTMHQRAGRRISIVGASQGGMVPRWALRFWPDLRPMVDDVIGLAPTNHGTTGALEGCLAKGCRPAEAQQAASSAFIAALNSGQETFPGISYTNVYTHNDQTVLPNLDDTGSSSLHGGDGLITNVAIQDICPRAVSEHILLGAIDFIGFALVRDALSHPGPADEATVAKAACSQPVPPGLILVPGVVQLPTLVLGNTIGLGAVPKVKVEPVLRDYTRR